MDSENQSPNPSVQTDEEIVQSLRTIHDPKYTAACHAEMMSRFAKAIKKFEKNSSRLEKVMLALAIVTAILAIVELTLAFS